MKAYIFFDYLQVSVSTADLCQKSILRYIQEQDIFMSRKYENDRKNNPQKGLYPIFDKLEKDETYVQKTALKHPSTLLYANIGIIKKLYPEFIKDTHFMGKITLIDLAKTQIKYSPLYAPYPEKFLKKTITFISDIQKLEKSTKLKFPKPLLKKIVFEALLN